MNLDQIEALMRLMRAQGALHVQCGDLVVTLGAAPGDAQVDWEETPEKQRDAYEELDLPSFDVTRKVQ